MRTARTAVTLGFEGAVRHAKGPGRAIGARLRGHISVRYEGRQSRCDVGNGPVKMRSTSLPRDYNRRLKRYPQNVYLQETLSPT
jgi:hypothetical protein